MFVDSLLIVSVSIVLNVVAEGLSWLLIYRHDQYKSLKRRIDNAHRKLEDTQSEREVKRLEAGLQVMKYETSSSTHHTHHAHQSGLVLSADERWSYSYGHFHDISECHHERL
eukprot:TRINITY_DN2646_c0_g1_i1.p3 TRINITY_DN2646_c0_g1~~TRINITY_DN2646_c0_g1_i1.p3  ORF type:complete len:112 (-),score=7.64 TRINITY_DN2646_c0_g1_i1:232-567(-)